eukprot:142636-Pelagomonas_calceolata.AAC.3
MGGEECAEGRGGGVGSSVWRHECAVLTSCKQCALGLHFLQELLTRQEALDGAGDGHGRVRVGCRELRMALHGAECKA